MCKDNKGRIIASLGKKLGDVPLFVAEAIAIRATFMIANDPNMGKILIESDPQLVFKSIRGLIKVPNQIINHVIDLVCLARKSNNIQSVIILGP